MKTIIGVRFKKTGKIYFFDPKGKEVKVGDHVIVETSVGEEYAEVMIANRQMEDEKIVSPLKPIIRVSTKEDDKHNEQNKAKEKEAFKIALKYIKKHKLDMNLIEIEYKFDNSKMLFYFTADGRIDFRELVKDLAAEFKTRIELRQIGVRDQVKRLGGNGVCGRELCCCTFLSNFDNVSIKMAKEQNLGLNPAKISGNCGRLMCCLKYEQDTYTEKLSRMPKLGAIVKTEDGEGIVDNRQTLKEEIRVKFQDKDGTFYKKYKASDVKVVKDVEEKEEMIEDEELKKLEE